MNLCVFGAASRAVDEKYMRPAEDFGRLAAMHGHTVYFGGGCTGLMGAVARGVTSADGELIGVAPEYFNTPGVLYEKCTEMILTGTIADRLAIFEERCECFAALPGGMGTLQELFETVTLRQLDQIECRIGLLNTCGYYDSLLDMFEHSVEEEFVGRRCVDEILVSDYPERLLEMLERD